MIHGKVTNVTFTDGVPVCTVQLFDRVNNEVDAPVSRMNRGIFMVPEVDQRVQLLKIEDQHFVVGVLARNVPEATPELSEGEICFQFDEETKLSFTKGESGYNIDIEASGNITIDGIDFDQHTHQYDGGGKNSSTLTSDPPE